MGEKFKTEHNATIFKSHGAVVKEYVKIPDGIFRETKVLSWCLDQVYHHVMTLKPK